MTLEELFKDKPELLDEPLVQKLVEYFKERHAVMRGFVEKAELKYSKVIDLCMHSEVMLINGDPSKDVIESILEDYAND